MGEVSYNRDEESDERRVMETHPNLAETVRSIMVEFIILRKTLKGL
jgi:hypothetical protein